MNTTTDNPTPDDGAELSPDLAALQAVAMAADARGAANDPAAQAQAQEQAARQQAEAQDAQRVGQLAGDLAVMLVPLMEGVRESQPWTSRTLTDDWTKQHCTLIAAVFVRRGWDLDRFMTPEWMLAGSLVFTGFKLSRDAKAYAAWLQAQQGTQGVRAEQAEEAGQAAG